MSDKNNCNHKWKFHTGVSVNTDTGYKPSTVICENCQYEISLSDQIQIEHLDVTKKESQEASCRSWISIVISILALIISIFIK